MRFNYSQLRPYIHFLLEWVRYTCLGNKRVILYLFRCKRSVSGKRKEKVNVWSELLRLHQERNLGRGTAKCNPAVET